MGKTERELIFESAAGLINEALEAQSGPFDRLSIRLDPSGMLTVNRYAWPDEDAPGEEGDTMFVDNTENYDVDIHHSKSELYDYRMAYHAFAVKAWRMMYGIRTVKSTHHSDGTPAFDGSWFIVVSQLPTGQVSNHYKMEHWDKFDVPIALIPPEYDGHTPQIALERVLELLARKDKF